MNFNVLIRPTVSWWMCLLTWQTHCGIILAVPRSFWIHHLVCKDLNIEIDKQSTLIADTYCTSLAELDRFEFWDDLGWYPCDRMPVTTRILTCWGSPFWSSDSYWEALHLKPKKNLKYFTQCCTGKGNQPTNDGLASPNPAFAFCKTRSWVSAWLTRRDGGVWSMTSPLPPMLAIVAAVFRFRVVGIPEPLKKKKSWMWLVHPGQGELG